MSLQLSLQLTLWLLSLSLVIQCTEMLAINKRLPVNTPWAWSNVRGDFAAWPSSLQTILDFIFFDRFKWLLYSQFLLILLLPLWPNVTLIVALLLCQLMIGFRFRGIFNGGSDYMTMTVILGLLLTLIPNQPPTLLVFGLTLIAIQTTLSYFIAGVVKIKTPAWRTGLALRVFLQHSNYSVPVPIKTLAQNPWLTSIASWGVMIWELTFPIIWFKPSLTMPYLALAVAFHIGNFVSFGINRFVFAWLASYPALYFCTHYFSSLKNS